MELLNNCKSLRRIAVATITRASLRVQEWTDKHTQFGLVCLLRDKAGIRVGQTTVSDWVRGYSTPHGERMIALQRLLGIDPADWFVPVLPTRGRGGPVPWRSRGTGKGGKPPGARTGTDD